MFIIEVLKALMRRLLIAGRKMIKVLPDVIRDGNKGLLITTEGPGRARPRLNQSLARLVPLCFPSILSIPWSGDF